MSPLASTWRRVREPGAPALRRALRVTSAVTFGFLVGRYAFDAPQTAVYATLTPVALLGLGEVAGSPSVRARAYAIAIVVGAGVTVVGTLASDDTLAASLTLFAGALLASQAGIAGSNAAGLARSELLLLIVSAGIPVPDSASADRVVGVAIGGASVLAAALLLWPDRVDIRFRRRLGAALDPLADAAGAVGRAAPACAGGGDRHRRGVRPRRRVRPARPFARRAGADAPPRGRGGAPSRGRVHRIPGGGRAAGVRARALERAARTHAQALVRGERGERAGAPRAARMRPAGRRAATRLDGVVHLLGLRAWIVELGGELERMRDTVATLTARPATG